VFHNGVLANETRYVRESYLPLQERDASGVTRSFVWGLHWGGGIAGLLEVAQAGASYSCIYDTKGNIVGLLDGAQNPAAAYTYDPFGNPIARAGTVNQPFRCSTMMFDEATGLAAFAYRYYAPALGRWLTRDPAGERQDPNLYAYVGNNPINWIDPLGMYQTGGASDPALNTIVCDGYGGVRVQYGNANGAGVSPCLQACIVAHEQFHANTAQKAAPNVCAGKGDGTQVLFSDAGEQRPDEVAASEAEINCLNRAKESTCKPCDKASADARITQMEGYRDSFK
jgi:RHS repeat-associated protein